MKLAALFLVAVSAYGQAINTPGNPTNNPNQINVTTSYLYLNKMHYAGTWSSTATYNSQDVVFYSGNTYVSLQVVNLNNNPASAALWWAVFPGSGGGGSSTWGGITGTLSNQTDLETALTARLLASNNLSDLLSAATARTNLGLGTAAQQAVSYFLQAANNLSDLANASTGRTNLGLGTAAVQSTAYFLQTANNLSDLASVSTARTNLGLGSAALQASSFFLQASNNLSDVASASTSRSNIGLGTFTGARKANGTGTDTQAACADLSNAAASCSTDATNASNISTGTLAAARGGAGSVNGALKGNGSGAVSQAACADLSNAAASCSTDATNASNISSGTLPAGRLPAPTASTLGGIESAAAVTAEFIDAISGGGVPHQRALVSGDVPNNGANTSGNANTATALAASPTNCSTGQFTTGVNASGTAQGCTTLSAVNPQTATYQVLAADFSGYKTITVASGTFTITLVASGSQPAAGQFIHILNYGSGVVTVAASGQNINGSASSQTLAAGSASAPTGLWVVSDGTNYFAQPFGASSSGGGGTCTWASGYGEYSPWFGYQGTSSTAGTNTVYVWEFPSLLGTCQIGHISLSEGTTGQHYVIGIMDMTTENFVCQSATKTAASATVNVAMGTPCSLTAGNPYGVFITSDGPLSWFTATNVGIYVNVNSGATPRFFTCANPSTGTTTISLPGGGCGSRSGASLDTPRFVFFY